MAYESYNLLTSGQLILHILLALKLYEFLYHGTLMNLYELNAYTLGILVLQLTLLMLFKCFFQPKYESKANKNRFLLVFLRDYMWSAWCMVWYCMGISGWYIQWVNPMLCLFVTIFLYTDMELYLTGLQAVEEFI
jgi:hypothetical protein